MSKALRSCLRTLADPAVVGESEYRLVYDFVGDLIDDGADWPLIECALENVETEARRVRHHMRTVLELRKQGEACL